MFVFSFPSIFGFLRSGGWLDFFLVDALHEIEGICEKVDGWMVRVRVRVRLTEVEFVVVVGVKVGTLVGR